MPILQNFIYFCFTIGVIYKVYYEIVQHRVSDDLMNIYAIRQYQETSGI